MQNQGFTKTFNAPVAVGGMRIAKISAVGEVAAAAAVTDALVGITTSVGTQDNGRCDVVLGGIMPVVAGAAVAIGSPITSNASGQAIVGSGTNVIIGRSLSVAAQSGDIIDVLIGRS